MIEKVNLLTNQESQISAPPNAAVIDRLQQTYQAGFVTPIESETIPPGLSEDHIRMISAKKEEPEFMLEWRLKAYRHWLTLTEPHWGTIRYPAIDYQNMVYYSA